MSILRDLLTSALPLNELLGILVWQLTPDHTANPADLVLDVGQEALSCPVLDVKEALLLLRDQVSTPLPHHQPLTGRKNTE